MSVSIPSAAPGVSVSARRRHAAPAKGKDFADCERCIRVVWLERERDAAADGAGGVDQVDGLAVLA